MVVEMLETKESAFNLAEDITLHPQQLKNIWPEYKNLTLCHV